ncbi:MAG: hypothetical protein IRZ00_06600 [Gemmatimonadetes bacterium]|nr:hypothetical protein [Gemmatimonadota bacterium]
MPASSTPGSLLCRPGWYTVNGREQHYGWQFSRNPRHWYLPDILPGSLLLKVPAQSRVPGVRALLPWSIWRPVAPDQWRKWCGLPAEVAADLIRMDRVEREPRYRAALRLLADPADFHVHIAEVAIPAARIAAGDVLVWVGGTRRRPHSRGPARELMRDDYEALRLALLVHGESAFEEITPAPSADAHRLSRFLRDRRRWGARRQPWRTDLVHIRPAAEREIVSIEASSDEAAIFELVYRAGGRLRGPAEG